MLSELKKTTLYCIIILLPLFFPTFEYIQNIFQSIENGLGSSNFKFVDILKTSTSTHIAQYFLITLISTGLFCYLHLLFIKRILSNINRNSLSLSILWSLLAGISLIQINSYFFPLSVYSYSSGILQYQIFIFVLFTINILAIFNLIYSFKKTIVSITLISIIIGIFPLQKNYNNEKTNVFIIGIDSLRPELIDSYMPFLSKQLESSTTLNQAYTPFARTYPAWVSILTGRHPINHGARFNLQDEKMLSDDNVYLTNILKENGYHTIYAADERRFSNLGNAHGFDEVIGPRTGASDFILGTYADFPTTNLLLLTPAGKYLLPELYANRAAHRLYSPRNFNSLIEASLNTISTSKPIFMATHFCLAHWPYTFNGHSIDTQFNEEPKYPANLVAVDQQISKYMNTLSKKGLLKNSILIFLSDHGENWGNFQTNLKNKKGEVYSGSDYGHGMNILSPNSHKILLSFKGFDIDEKQINKPSSLIDITPTTLDQLGYLQSLDPSTFDGRSLIQPLTSDIEMTFESGVIIAEANKANPNPEEVAKAGTHRFTIKENGQLSLRSELIPTMISAKQRGLRINNHGLFHFNTSSGWKWVNINYDSKTYEKDGLPSVNTPSSLMTRFCQLFQKESSLIRNECVSM